MATLPLPKGWKWVSGRQAAQSRTTRVCWHAEGLLVSRRAWAQGDDCEGIREAARAVRERYAPAARRTLLAVRSSLSVSRWTIVELQDGTSRILRAGSPVRGRVVSSLVLDELPGGATPEQTWASARATDWRAPARRTRDSGGTGSRTLNRDQARSQ